MTEYQKQMIQIAERLAWLAEPGDDGSVDWDECAAQNLAQNARDVLQVYGSKGSE
jgi:hypothetical protein